MAYPNLKQYVIGDTTATELIKIIEWTKPIWQGTDKDIYLEEFLTELKCQVE